MTRYWGDYAISPGFELITVRNLHRQAEPGNFRIDFSPRPKISRAKALMRFPRYRAALEAAREEN